MTNATAARHNNLQTRLQLILGIGSGDSGYGQGLSGYGEQLSSYQVSNQSESNLNIMSAADINAVYADMLRARVHQIGTEPIEIAQLVANLNIIAEETSGQVGNDGVLVQDLEGNKKGIADYERLMTSIETDRFLIHSSQATLEPAISNSRSEVWNGLIYHEFTVSFLNENHRRHFFNSGGEIRIYSSITGPTSLKGQDWAVFMGNVGTVRMNYNSTVSSSNSGGLPIGNYDLSSSYQVIYQKSSQGTLDEIYAGNLYKISARTIDLDKIQFKVEYNDVSTGNFVDVNVDGILQNIVQFYRADSNYVSVPRPTITTNSSLSTFLSQQPVYILSSSIPAVSEGSSVVINLTTINVPNGEEVPYNIQGVTLNDINGASLSGNFVIQNNIASITINMSSDLIPASNDAEVMTVRLANGSSSISINIVDAT